jgi:hypothetical protein
VSNRYRYIDTEKAHLHTLDGKPLIGTSTATKIIAKPLTWWASGMAVEKFGWLSPNKFHGEACQAALDEGYARVMALSKDEYAALLNEAYRAHNTKKEKAADDGTDRHAALEVYVKTVINLFEGRPAEMTKYEDPAVETLVKWSQDNVKRFLWSEINGYSEVLWTGGIADVGWEDFNGRIIAGDFKSGGPYFDQFVQVAGYDLMLSENGGLTADGEKIFELPGPIEGYCVLPFDPDKFEPRYEYDVDAYRKGFRAAVHLSKVQIAYEGVGKRKWK